MQEDWKSKEISKVLWTEWNISNEISAVSRLFLQNLKVVKWRENELQTVVYFVKHLGIVA